jgi:hypothetical protein
VNPKGASGKMPSQTPPQLRAVEPAYHGEAQWCAAGDAVKERSAQWRTLRDAGNLEFGRGSFAAACEKYADALMFISLTDRPARVHLLTNRALAHLQAAQLSQAMWDCESVLHLLPPRGTSQFAALPAHTTQAVMKALYVKGMALKAKGDAENAVIALRQVWTLSGDEQQLLASQDRPHVQEVLKELGAEEKRKTGGVVVQVVKLVRRLVESASSHIVWDLTPLLLIWLAWVFISVLVCSSSAADKPDFMLDVQRAQTMSVVGVFSITFMWHSWGSWEAAEKKKQGPLFRTTRENVLGWWAVARALGVRTSVLLIRHRVAALFRRALATSLQVFATQGGSFDGASAEDTRSKLKEDLADIVSSFSAASSAAPDAVRESDDEAGSAADEGTSDEAGSSADDEESDDEVSGGGASAEEQRQKMKEDHPKKMARRAVKEVEEIEEIEEIEKIGDEGGIPTMPPARGASARDDAASRACAEDSVKPPSFYRNGCHVPPEAPQAQILKTCSV